MDRDSLNRNLDKFDKVIRHYETIAWQVTALFVAAIAILISIPIDPPPSFFLYFLGLAITISAILFNISFRRRQHFYICAKRKTLKQIKNGGNLEECEKLELIINDCFKNYRVNQWYSYLVLFSLIISYWLYKLFWWIETSYLNLIPYTFITKIIFFFFAFLISVLFCLNLKTLGDFEKSECLFEKSERKYYES